VVKRVGDDETGKTRHAEARDALGTYAGSREPANKATHSILKGVKTCRHVDGTRGCQYRKVMSIHCQ
jgi:hypothetical protein